MYNSTRSVEMEQQAAVGGFGSGQANLKPIKQEKKTTKTAAGSRLYQ